MELTVNLSKFFQFIHFYSFLWLSHLERARCGRMTLASAATNPSESLQVSWNLAGSEGPEQRSALCVCVIYICVYIYIYIYIYNITFIVFALFSDEYILKNISKERPVSFQSAKIHAEIIKLGRHIRHFTHQHLEDLPWSLELQWAEGAWISHITPPTSLSAGQIISQPSDETVLHSTNYIINTSTAFYSDFTGNSGDSISDSK